MRLGSMLAGVALLTVVAFIGAVPEAAPRQDGAGWKTLFDGKTLSGWRSFKTPTPPSGWQAVDGALAWQSQSGDIMTIEQYGDFELQLEWKLEKGGNSGVIYRVGADGPETWSTGPEMQLLDNGGHPDGKNPLTSAGSAYAVYAPSKDVTKPIGEWNAARLVAKGAHVEHWLNGVKIVDYELWSPDWKARVNASKFAPMPGYGRSKQGHIALQDHGDPVWYRNIRLRPR